MDGSDLITGPIMIAIAIGMGWDGSHLACFFRTVVIVSLQNAKIIEKDFTIS